LEVDEAIVEQAKLMGMHIIWKAERKYVSTRLLKWAFFLKVHHDGNGNTHPTDGPLG
jgi:hypothetical protein